MAGVARNHWLTVVRFFAALWVVLHHMPFLRDATPLSNVVHQLSISGFAGVTLFFVLSGVVLALSYEGKVDTVAGIARFYWARLTRIVPLWFLVSLPILISKDFRGDGFLAFMTFTQAWAPDRAIAFGYLAVAWTLSVEMFFYAVFPLIMYLTGPLRRARAAGASLVAIGVAIPILGAAAFQVFVEPNRAELPEYLTSHWLLYRLPAARLGDFVTGVGLFYLAKEAPGLRRFWPAYCALGVAAGAVALWTTNTGTWGWDAAWIVPFALLLFGLIGAPQRLTDKTPAFAILLGEASFALYLIHQKYIIPMVSPWYGPPTEHLLAASVTSAAVAIFLSVGLFVLFERPVMRFLRNPLPRSARAKAFVSAPAE